VTLVLTPPRAAPAMLPVPVFGLVMALLLVLLAGVSVAVLVHWSLTRYLSRAVYHDRRRH